MLGVFQAILFFSCFYPSPVIFSIAIANQSLILLIEIIRVRNRLVVIRGGNIMIIDKMNIRDDRQFKALTGISFDEFQQLLPVFTENYKELIQERYEDQLDSRQRKPGGGQKGKLPSMEMKLLFILYYWKVYPTFDVLGLQFGLDRSKACTNVHALRPVLQRSLEKLGVLPARKFCSIEELKAAFGDVYDLFIDATERPHCRPQDSEEQKNKYSGKKKRHTVKNTVISTVSKWILFLGYTVAGSIHDYTQFKEEFPVDGSKEEKIKWFEDFAIWLDLGYQGIQSLYEAAEINIPHKKPRKSAKNPSPSLTKEQKVENHMVSQMRVVVEHAIGGFKRFNILVHRFRNHMDDFVDIAVLLAAGLWNWKLKCQGVTY